MALTRDFKETIMARAQRDAKFRQALITESLNAYLAGDSATGKAIVHDLINATSGSKVSPPRSTSPARAFTVCSATRAILVPKTCLTSSALCSGRPKSSWR